MIQEKTVQYAKEIDDVLVLVVKIIEMAKAGQDVMAIASGAVAPLIDAVAGIQGAGEELSLNKKVVFETVGYRVGEIAGALVA